MENFKNEAIHNLLPVSNNGYSMVNDDLESIIWYDDNHPSIDQIQAEISRLTIEYEAQEYARNRKSAYDALNQLELISDDSINGTTTHKDAILAIKAKYPKV